MVEITSWIDLPKIQTMLDVMLSLSAIATERNDHMLLVVEYVEAFNCAQDLKDHPFMEHNKRVVASISETITAVTELIDYNTEVHRHMTNKINAEAMEFE